MEKLSYICGCNQKKQQTIKNRRKENDSMYVCGTKARYRIHTQRDNRNV